MKNVTPNGDRIEASFWNKLTFACKTETLGFLYSRALLILTENQVVHEQKFRDLLSSTCQVSPERNQRLQQAQVLFHWGFHFSRKASDAYIDIISNFV